MDQMDSFSVSSAGGYGGVEPAGQRLYLTPAQVALQEQLKSKHSELSRRIALQQAELIRSVYNYHGASLNRSILQSSFAIFMILK